jgi:hypothetical protein
MTLPADDAKVDVHAEVRALLDAWCDRRAYHAICVLYGGYRSLNGLTDGWEEFLESLKQLRILAKDQSSKISAPEAAKIQSLIGVVSRGLNWR